eukprot:gene37206-biopygen30939
MHGQGQLTCPDGRTLTGEFESNQFHNGVGSILHKDGSLYEGEVKEGKPAGKGKLTKASGLVLEGEFRKGKIFNGTSGRSTKWVNGKKVPSTSPATPSSEKEVPLVPNVALSTSADLLSEKNAVIKVVSAKSVAPEAAVPVSPASVSLLTHSAEETTDALSLVNKNSTEQKAFPVSHVASSPALITTTKGVVFNGVFLDKTKKHGKGQIKYPDGSVYEGVWLNSKKHGQ